MASGDVAFITHHVETECGATAELRNKRIHVYGEAARLIRAEIESAGNEVVQFGSLGGLIDDAAGGSAAERYRRWSLENFNFFHIEGIAIVAAEITHAIDEEIIARAETADGEVIALRAAFTRRDTDTGNVAQRIAQRGDVLLFESFLRNDADGL